MGLPNPRHRPDFYLSWMWAILLVPTLIWWSESVTWVLILSLYANWAASRASDRAKVEAMRREKD